MGGRCVVGKAGPAVATLLWACPEGARQPYLTLYWHSRVIDSRVFPEVT